MNVYVMALLWVLGSVLVAALLMMTVRRFVPEEHRHSGDEASSRVFTVVAGLEAVLTAFVLISVFDTVDTARTNSYHEADSLVAVYWDADLLPAGARDQIRELVHAYASTVVNQEWPAMQEGTPVAETGRTQLDQIHNAIAAVVPDSFSSEDRQTQISTDLTAVYQDRQQRLDAAADRVHPIVWLALIAGAVLSVGLTCLFGGEKLRTHLVVASALAATITILLFTTYQLQNPFGGVAPVGPEAFAAALSQFG